VRVPAVRRRHASTSGLELCARSPPCLSPCVFVRPFPRPCLSVSLFLGLKVCSQHTNWTELITFVHWLGMATVNKDEYIMLILEYKVSLTYDRLGRCFRFVYIYACIAVFFCVATVSR